MSGSGARPSPETARRRINAGAVHGTFTAAAWLAAMLPASLEGYQSLAS